MPLNSSEVTAAVEPAGGYGAKHISPAGYFRWVICLLLFLAATINYIDRQVIGLLKPVLQAEIRWNEIDYSNIVFVLLVPKLEAAQIESTLAD